MERISFQITPVTGEKEFKDCMKSFDVIMETLLYLQDVFPKLIEGAKDTEDRYGVEVTIAFDADCIEAQDGRKGFGVFDTENDRIYLAADIPEAEDTLIETTAHEFMHFIQKIRKDPYSEEEAEHFAQTAKFQVKRRIAESRAQHHAKKPIRKSVNPAQYITSKKKRRKIVHGK